MRSWWTCALAVVVMSAAVFGQERPPNVIIILTDDQGYNDLGCYGSRLIRTPRIDRMAAEGIRFTDFYSPAAVCTPTRAGLLTGAHPQRLGLSWIENERPGGRPAHVLFWHSRHGLHPDEITIAEALKEIGYATACVGKWHLGDAPEFLPTAQGFDSYYGIPYSNDMKPTVVMRDEEIVEEEADQDTITRRYTEEALNFIRENRDRPFFLFLSHTQPHVPLHVSERFRGKSAGGLYGDVIEEIDWSVGEVLDALREAGVDEHTLVLFTSDNGPWLFRGEAGGLAFPLRGGKGTTYEGGMRVPTIARWPGKVPAGTECREPLTQLDFFPTIVKLCGAPMHDRVIDGKDISAILLGHPGAKSPHEAIYYYANGNLHAVRSGKWKFKLETTLQEETEYGRYEQPDAKIPEALYDLENDISEQRNVMRDYPEVVEKMRALAAKARADLGDRRRGVVGKGVREIGRSDHFARMEEQKSGN